MAYPIPREALDDRLGFIGTSGSGKTYNAGGAVERLLKSRARVVIVDPLGVWWGLRLLADGKTASSFNVAIFGGAHGDLPLTENAGALIGETAATMAESCIVDLNELGSKSAERRFMTAFLETIYRKAPGEPFHLVVDEADLFAPQKPPKGDETLLNLMEQIVRRGRVRGFIPWLISQRPAVLNKNVLSQVDGLVAFKLTASQDRDALDGWIEGQADKAQGKAIKDALPAMQIGNGVVWVPGRGVLQTAAFPLKETFDSSRTPKRGEKKLKTAELKPLDLGALKSRLASVETEAKANDPKALRAEIAKLKADAAKAPKSVATPDRAYERTVEGARKEGFGEGYAAGWADGDRTGWERGVAEADKLWTAALRIAARAPTGYVPQAPRLTLATAAAQAPKRHPEPGSRAVTSSAPRAPRSNGHDTGLPTPHRRVLAALSFWASVGHSAPTREQVAGVAGYSPGSGGFNNILGVLATTGMIHKPQAGRVALSEAAPQIDMTPSEAREKLLSVMTGPERKTVDALDGDTSPVARDEVAKRTGYSAGSGGFNHLLGHLCTLTIFEKPMAGYVALSEWASQVLAA